MKVKITNEKIELLRNELEKLIANVNSLQDNRVLSLSHKLDKLICNYYLQNEAKLCQLILRRM